MKDYFDPCNIFITSVLRIYLIMKSKIYGTVSDKITDKAGSSYLFLLSPVTSNSLGIILSCSSSYSVTCYTIISLISILLL